MRGRVSATALRAGATLSVALLAFGPASAQSVSISTDQSTPVDIPDGYDFSNTATIDVDLTFFDPAVTALGSVPVFVNGSTGVIVSQGSNAVELFDVGSFNNLGSISAYDLAVGADHIGDFNNSGSIQGLFGLQAGRIDTFANSGTISGDEVAVMIYGAPRSFSNSGSIVSAGTIGSSDGIGVILVEGVGSFVNTGTIYGYSAGVMIGANADPSVTTAIVNSGTIETDPCGCGLFGLAFSGGTLVNSGTISSAMGVLLVPGGSQNTTVTNSGTIEGTAPVDSLPFAPFSDLTVAMLFDSITPTEDVLRLLPGSRILGAVGFGPGEDTLDLTRYQGSSFQLYYDLENVLTGGGIILDSHSPDLRMVGTIDDTAVRSFGAAQFGNHASMLLAAIGSARGSAGGPVPSELGYLPSAAQSDAAVAAGMLATPLPGPRVWGAALGGASADATVGNSRSQLLGGVVAGADVAAGNGGLAGGLVNLGAGRFATPARGQVITSTLGTLGLYGATDLGAASLDLALLAGGSLNHSEREISGIFGIETAVADYASWFVSPSVALNAPLALFDAVETEGGLSLMYVGGVAGAYQETGAMLNLSVPARAIHLLEARADLSASTTLGGITLTGTAGVLGSANLGASDTVLGIVSPLGGTNGGLVSTAPGAFASGAFVHAAAIAPIGKGADLTFRAGAEIRSDAVAAASGSLALKGAF